MVKLVNTDITTGSKDYSLYRTKHVIRLKKQSVYREVVSKYIKILSLTVISFLLAPFITSGQDEDIETLIPAACYNFVDDFENDNGESGVAPLEPNGGTGTFIEAEELCLNGNNKHYSMSSSQGLDVDNGTLISTSQYTIELLFRVDDIPNNNQDGRVFIMNFFNQNKAGLFINPDGYLCFYPNSGAETCGPDLVSPDYPTELPSEWINIAYLLKIMS
jgi:hypothetical protein